MAMNAATLETALKSRIISEINSFHPLTDATAIQVRDDMAAAIAEAVADEVVSHIQSFATVATAVTVTSVAGVTTGAGVSGPGSGTGTGSVS